CVYVKARDAERMLKELIGDPKVLMAQIMAASQPPRDFRGGFPGGDGRDFRGGPDGGGFRGPPGGGAPAQPAQKFRMFYITADERTNSVLVNGPPDIIAKARDALKRIDIPQPGGKQVSIGPPTFQTYTVAAGAA